MAKNYENENKAKNYSTDKTSDKNAMDSRKQFQKTATQNAYQKQLWKQNIQCI